MGWPPDQVRATTLQDFEASFEGYKLANGIEPDTTAEDIEALDELMARYPDKPKAA